MSPKYATFARNLVFPIILTVHFFHILDHQKNIFWINYRKSLTDIADQGHLDENKKLFVDGQEVIFTLKKIPSLSCSYHSLMVLVLLTV